MHAFETNLLVAPTPSITEECLPYLLQQNLHLNVLLLKSPDRFIDPCDEVSKRGSDQMNYWWDKAASLQDTIWGQINGKTILTMGGKHMELVNFKWQC